ncbi:hypothetical protein ECOT7509_4853 [Escherichia coli TW07509]|nr:hypothetical protein ECOT7509_4853 [Escherichia coli TW07509]
MTGTENVTPSAAAAATASPIQVGSLTAATCHGLPLPL